MTGADILVIDDEAGPRDSLRMILKDQHEVRIASSGPEALRMIDERKPDVVFVDIRMPGMDGTEVMRRIKGLDPNIEVAIITAYAAVDSAQEAVRHGALDYLTKPFGIEAVRNVVDRALERRQKRVEQDAMMTQLRQLSETLARRLQEVQPDEDDQMVLYDQLASAHTSVEDQLSNVGRLSAIGEIAAEVAHDVNNFLSALLLRIEILLMKTHDSDQLSAEEIVEALHEMEGAARDSVQTVERISSFAKSDPFEPNEPVQVNEILKSAADVSLGRAQHDAQHIVWELQEVPEIVGNATALRTVFVNLFINAWHAMPHGGEIRVTTSSDEGNVTIELSDTGSGMPPEVLERLTEAFFTTKEEGTGLGLSIARKVIDRHGGSIAFDSALGVGTTVTVSLPVAGPAERPDDSPAAADVLLIDVYEGLIVSLRSLLEAHGWAVTTATSGVAGLAEFESFLAQHRRPPRAVIIDLLMPDLDGTHLAERIKQLAPQTHTVLLSGYVGEEPEAAAYPHFDAVMTKPFDPAELVKHIAEVAELPSPSY